jgi:tetratricopeptide (TPR) repeat protein
MVMRGTAGYLAGLAALAALVTGGCGATLQPASQPANPRAGAPASQPKSEVTTLVMEPIQVVARMKDGKREYEVFDAAGLFEQAGAHLQARRFDQAIATYDRLVREFPDSRYVAPSLYNAGLAHEAKRDWGGAVARFKTAADRAKSPRDATDALFHLGACYSEADNHAAAAEVFARLLDRSDLAPADRVEAMVRRGFAQHQLKDLQAAERTFRDTIGFYRKADQEQRLDADFFLAMAHYYLAEIPHQEFKRLPIRLPEKQMERDLEAKARLLLTAQGRYIATINVRNPHWATASGFQVGALYREFYDAVVGAPIPHGDLRRRAKAAGVTYEEVLKAYVEQVRQYMRPLLENAIKVHEKNVQMAERTGVDNDWVKRSNEQLESLKVLLAGKDTAASPGAPRPAATQPAATPPKPGDAPSRKPKRDYYPRVTL